MNRDEFLAQTEITALSDNDALASLHAHTVTKLWRIVGADRKTIAITALINEGTQKRLSAYIADVNNPAPIRELAEKLKAVLDPDLLLKSEIYRINLGDEEVKAGFDAGVSYGLINAREAADLIKAATYVERPFINTTLHELKINRGTVTLKPITQTNGYVVINILSDCDLHNPRLLATNPRTNKIQRISSFYGVSDAGKYECIVPSEWRNAELFVDDVYSVIE